MPTYQYRCSECGNELEAVQKFTDAALTECPTCTGSLRKVFNAVGVVFKGSGFYRTDSRSADKKAASSSGAAGKSDGAGAEKKSSDSGTSSTERSGDSAAKQPATAASSSGSGSSASGSTSGSSTAA